MNFFNFNLFHEYSFSILLFNVFSYIFILINIFTLFFLFDTKYIKTLSDLKILGNLPLITTYIIILLLSFAGIPPLLGFISKFVIFLFIVSKNNYFYLSIFVFMNMFVIYFYIQNLRFITSKKIKNNFFYKNYIVVFNYNLLFFFNFLNYFNIFAVFYFEEFFIFLNNIISLYSF